MKIDIGLILEDKDFSCHFHGWGISESGKSSMLLSFIRQLIRWFKGVISLDPHSTLNEWVLVWLAYIRPKRQVYLMDCGQEDHIVGWNPWRSKNKSPAAIWTKSDHMLAAVLKVWGLTREGAPTLVQWLPRIFYLIIEQDLTIAIVDYFLTYESKAERLAIIEACQNEGLKAELLGFHKKPKKEYEAELLSIRNRLGTFQHPQLRRIFCTPQTIDLEAIIHNRHILLVSLQESDIFSLEDSRIVGTLMLNEIENIFSIKPEDKNMFFVAADECQRFLTDSIPVMLDELRKRGLCLCLFHQRESQLGSEISSSLQNAKTKIMFSTQAKPKPQRHYELLRSDGTRQEGVVPEVKRFFVSKEKLEAYRLSLVGHYLSGEEVDVILRTTPTQLIEDDDDGARY